MTLAVKVTAWHWIGDEADAETVPVGTGSRTMTVCDAVVPRPAELEAVSVTVLGPAELKVTTGLWTVDAVGEPPENDQFQPVGEPVEVSMKVTGLFT